MGGPPGDIDRDRLRATMLAGVVGGLRPGVLASHAAPRLVRATLAGWRRHLPKIILAGLVGFAISWAWNIYVMASRYDGFRVPGDTPITGVNNQGVQPALYWLLVPMVLSALVSFVIVRGPRKAFRDLSGFPGEVRDILSDRAGTTVVRELLWGYAGTMLFVILMAGYLSAAFGLVLIFALATALRSLVVAAAMMIWRVAKKRLPGRDLPLPTTTRTLTVTFGSVAAFAVGFLANSLPTIIIAPFGVKLLSGIAAGFFAWKLGRDEAQAMSPAEATTMFFLVGVAAWWVLGDGFALADDGGMAECGMPGWNEWLSSCGGSDRVVEAGLTGGVIGGTGAATGVLAGAGAAGPGDDDDDGGGGGDPMPWPTPDQWDDMSPTERQRWKRQLIQYWRRQNPGADWGPMRELMSSLENPNGFEAFWDQAKAGGKGIISDLTSLEGWQRIGGTAIKTPGKILKVGHETVAGIGTMTGYVSGRGVEGTVEDIGTFMGEKGIDFDDVPGMLEEQLGGAYNEWCDKLQTAMLNGDADAVTDMLSDVSGTISFEVILGWASQPGRAGGAAMRTSLQETADSGMTVSARIKTALREGTEAAGDSYTDMKRIKPPFESFRLRKKAPTDGPDGPSKVPRDPTDTTGRTKYDPTDTSSRPTRYDPTDTSSRPTKYDPTDTRTPRPHADPPDTSPTRRPRVTDDPDYPTAEPRRREPLRAKTSDDPDVLDAARYTGADAGDVLDAASHRTPGDGNVLDAASHRDPGGRDPLQAATHRDPSAPDGPESPPPRRRDSPLEAATHRSDDPDLLDADRYRSDDPDLLDADRYRTTDRDVLDADANRTVDSSALDADSHRIYDDSVLDADTHRTADSNVLDAETHRNSPEPAPEPQPGRRAKQSDAEYEAARQRAVDDVRDEVVDANELVEPDEFWSRVDKKLTDDPYELRHTPPDDPHTAADIDGSLDEIRERARTVEPSTMTPEQQARRAELEAEARRVFDEEIPAWRQARQEIEAGVRNRNPDMTDADVQDVVRRELHERGMPMDEPRVTISFREGEELFGVDQRLTLERQQTLWDSARRPDESGTSIYKLGDEGAVISNRLRTEHPDVYTGKWNPTPDKGYVPGEEALMSPEDLARFEDHPPLPGETINYTPRELSKADLAAIEDPRIRDRYNARAGDADEWSSNTGFENRRTIDYSDPNTVGKYGNMWVPEDPANPVARADFWKDPTDNRVYVRYQTKDGTWHPPRRQASDVDTVTHTGGSNMDYDTSRDLQYSQSGGQLGEGDTPNWGLSQVDPQQGFKGTIDPGTGQLEPIKQKLALKAIDSLVKADGEPVIKQTYEGLSLGIGEYEALGELQQAALKLDAIGGWSPENRQRLVGWGILPEQPGAAAPPVPYIPGISAAGQTGEGE